MAPNRHATTWVIPAVVVAYFLFTVAGQQVWSPWNKDDIDVWRDKPWGGPNKPFDDKVAVRTYYGDVRGFSVPWHIDDLNWDEKLDEEPPWYTKRINCFLGIPYAEAPLGELRFKRPRPPKWGGTWEALYYRPSCPQEIDEIRTLIPEYPRANISEDCLYMNIFVPNITWHSRATLYPVVVWIHSGDFISGSAQMQPGHVLATREVVVVTFNYRLGALGFMTTEDEITSGNYGLYDQHQALEFVKENIKAFKGDPTKITIAGDQAGAVSVGMHLLSPLTRGKNFFHQAILMSGTDLSKFGFVNPYWKPRDYAYQLANMVGCKSEDTYVMIKCMRNNQMVTWRMILEAQRDIRAKDGALGVVWGPTQDGGWFNTYRHQQMPYLPQTPIDLRASGEYDVIPMIIGLNTQDGQKKAVELFGWKELEAGIVRSRLRSFISELLIGWNIDEPFRQRAAEAVEFQYTWWADPDNTSAQTQEVFNLLTDINYGMAMDEVIKQNAPREPTYMYQFNFKSWTDWLPNWMGVGYSAAVPYVFGFPMMNETVLNQTELVARQEYDYEDRNMSDWMIYLWTNFIKYGRPTVNETYNITWEPFTFNNLSFLQIEDHSHIWFRYRQNKFSFWRDYFPEIAKQVPYFATPTPEMYEYVISTGSLGALMIILLCGVAMLAYLLWWQAERTRRLDEDRHDNIPMSFMSAATRSQSKQSMVSLGSLHGRSPASSAGTQQSFVSERSQPSVAGSQYSVAGPYSQASRGRGQYPGVGRGRGGAPATGALAGQGAGTGASGRGYYPPGRGGPPKYQLQSTSSSRHPTQHSIC